jgi:hypothetical protein
MNPPDPSYSLIATSLLIATLPSIFRTVTSQQFGSVHIYLQHLQRWYPQQHKYSYLDQAGNIVRPAESHHMLWLGDFNRHHPMWEGETNDRLFNSDEFIQPFLAPPHEHNMVLALPKDIPTYETATGNRTRPDGVWCTENADGPIICCDVLPSIRPPLAILDLPLPRPAAPNSRNFRMADWPSICKKLDRRLKAESPAVLINTKDEFIAKVDGLVHTITAVLEEEVPATNPSPYTRRWWTKELTDLNNILGLRRTAWMGARSKWDGISRHFRLC